MATIAATGQPPATPEEIWALLRETDRIVKETAQQMRETDRRMQETDRQRRETEQLVKDIARRQEDIACRQKETARQMQETGRRMQGAAKRNEETDRLFKENAEYQKETAQQMRLTDWKIDKLQINLGGLNSSMGDLAETLIGERLWEKFAGYPYNLQRAQPKVPVHDENHRVITNIDILLWDGEWVMAVEVRRSIKDGRESAEEEDVVARHVRRMAEIRRYPPAAAAGKKLLGAIAAGIVEPNTREKAHKAGFFVLELQGESVGLAPPPAGFEPKVW